jgi:hypothetical protein
MEPNELSDDALIDTLASTAVKADDLDLDLVSSGRRFSTTFAALREELFLRMAGADSQENEKNIGFLMESAIKANHDGIDTPSEAEYLVQKNKLLEKISDKSQQAQLASAK